MQPAAFFREAGCGPGVVCVHSNASSCHMGPITHPQIVNPRIGRFLEEHAA